MLSCYCVWMRCEKDIKNRSELNRIFADLKRGDQMETWYYEVVSIDGDYANLRRTDIESDDLKLVARALLPPEIVEGSRLKYEMMTYSMET